ncbi:MAG: hypothetical protein ACFFE4_22015 [Candidatus Thorarchaeota archaeon]
MTINGEFDVKEVLKMGIDVIITDDVELVIKILTSSASEFNENLFKKFHKKSEKMGA